MKKRRRLSSLAAAAAAVGLAGFVLVAARPADAAEPPRQPGSFTIEAVGFHGDLPTTAAARPGGASADEIDACPIGCIPPRRYQYVNVSWRDSSTDETSFTLQRCVASDDCDRGPDAPWVDVVTMPARPGTGFVWRHRDDYLPEGITHCYRAVASNAAGSSRSSYGCGAAGVPSKPGNPQITGSHDVYFDVEFSRSAEYENGYRVYARRADQTQWTSVATCHVGGLVGNQQSNTCLKPDGIAPNTFRWLADDLQPLTDYCVRLTAFTYAGESAPTAEACGRTRIPRPAAPTDFRATDVSDTSVTLAWTDNSSSDEYTKLYRASGGNTLLQQWGPTSGALTFTVTGLRANTEYRYRLNVGNAGGSSNVELTVTTTSAPETRTVSLQRQPVWKGFIPYLGEFPALGTVPRGHLVQIRVPQIGPVDTSIYFVKAGHSTTECNDPNAVVPVDEGSTTNPRQISAIYGQAEPAFSSTNHLFFVACIATNAGEAPNYRNIEITVEFD